MDSAHGICRRSRRVTVVFFLLQYDALKNPVTAKISQKTQDSFFSAKRDWSIIKDRVLGNYMVPYLAKVKRLNRPILLIDCFAGRGRFYDGKPGSPLIMCQTVDKYAKRNCRCLFVNKSKLDHELLKQALRLFTEKKIAFPIRGDSQSLLMEVRRLARNFTLFIYLDPFGLKGCEFGVIKDLLDRGNNRSTEILINLMMPTVHRFASVDAIKDHGITKRIQSFHRTLDDVLGGSYWRQYMFDDSLSAAQKEENIMEDYRGKLKTILPYVGSCPVREKKNTRVKYFITFCSRHPDAMVLMNDFMCSAYNDYMQEAEFREFPLLAGAVANWKTRRDKEKSDLKYVIIQEIKMHSGKTRLQLWEQIVQDHFMIFLQTEYKAVINGMFNAGEIDTPTPRPSFKLNDNCVLRLTARE